MSTEADIVERLQHPNPINIAKRAAAIAEITKLRAERDALRKLITDFQAGDYEPRIKKSEKCAHVQYGYEACEACIEEHFTKGLALLATERADD